MDSFNRKLAQGLMPALLIIAGACQSSPAEDGTEQPQGTTSQPATKAPSQAKVQGYLIVNYEQSKVVRLDKDGLMVWQLQELFYPSDAKMLPNSNILIAEQADGAVREYSPDGDVIWEFRDLQRPRSAAPLANGNVLIADPTGQRVIEVTRDKKVVWALSKRDFEDDYFRPFHAARLANGNSLVVDFGGKRVIEVNPAKKVVWKFDGQCIDAERLPNGNTLMVQVDGSVRRPKQRNLIPPNLTLEEHLATTRYHFQAIEVDASNRVVWKIELEGYPYDADRLPNGNTLVAEEGGVRIYDRDGKIVRHVFKSWSYEADQL